MSFQRRSERKISSWFHSCFFKSLTDISDISDSLVIETAGGDFLRSSLDDYRAENVPQKFPNPERHRLAGRVHVEL